MSCKVGQASFICICKSGWQGEKCVFGMRNKATCFWIDLKTFLKYLSLLKLIYFSSFLDINECKDPANINGDCSQFCDNIPDSYQCSCESGFVMLSNKKDCKGKSKKVE